MEVGLFRRRRTLRRGFRHRSWQHCRQKLIQRSRKFRRFFGRREFNRDECLGNVLVDVPGGDEQARRHHLVSMRVEPLDRRLEFSWWSSEFKDWLEQVVESAGMD